MVKGIEVQLVIFLDDAHVKVFCSFVDTPCSSLINGSRKTTDDIQISCIRIFESRYSPMVRGMTQMTAKASGVLASSSRPNYLQSVNNV